MELIELKNKLDELDKRAADLTKFLDLGKKEQRLQEIETNLADSAIWNNPKKSALLFKEKKVLETDLNIGKMMTRSLNDIETYFSLIDEDPSLVTELEQEIVTFEQWVEEAEIHNYLRGETDANNAFLSIHPGAGGTESQDWAEMLLRMYLRFGERSKYKVEIIELMAGEEAGIKSVTVKFDGSFAYGYLKQ